MSLAMLAAPVPANVPSDFWNVLDIFNASFLKINNNALYISVLVFVFALHDLEIQNGRATHILCGQQYQDVLDVRD